jgi:OmpA-OmpF porin, OOP family
MNRRLLLSALFACLAIGTPGLLAAAEDHPLIQRYPGSKLTSREDLGFREYAIVTAFNAKGKTDQEILPTTPVSGELTRLFYESPAERSPLEIFANYKEGLEKAGFQVLFECAEAACGPSWASSRWGRVNGMRYVSSPMWYLAARHRKDGGDTYVALSVVKLRHQIDVLQGKPMEQGLVTVTAEALKKGLAAEGRAVLDGIVFDHDKATIKPESKPALDVIASFLKSDPKLKVFIVGHTDTTGTLDYNLNLSRQRAEAVVQTLTKSYGIAADRLSAHGVGPLSPARTNRSEQGKSQNRRVEMVERN